MVSAIVTIIVVVGEWVDNPGGIFRSDAGTHWPFVADTAISWFVPTLVYVSVLVSALQLAWHVAARYRGKRR